MPLSVNEHYHAAVITITGRFLGSVEGPALKDALDDLKQAGRTQVVIDLSETEFMDSSGIGALIGGLTSMRKAGGDVRLAGMKKKIRNVFLMTRLLGGVFDDYDTVDEALQSYESHPPTPAAEDEEA